MTWPAHVHHGNNTIYDGPPDPDCFICRSARQTHVHRSGPDGLSNTYDGPPDSGCFICRNLIPLARADHRLCGQRWGTTLAWHECGSPFDHPMEHRCNCGELYPS